MRPKSPSVRTFAEVLMKRVLVRLLVLSLFAAPAATQVVNITIAAGTPEDKESQAITNEADAQKRVALWNEFVQKFSANPMAVAYGALQLAQQLQSAGDLNGGLAAAEKAYAALPNSFEPVMNVVTRAQT